MSTQVATRYAKALFELAVEKNQFIQVHLSLHDFVDLMRRYDEFRILFFSQAVEAKVKIHLLHMLLKKDTNELFFNFLKVLVLKRRTAQVFQILAEFERHYAKKQNRLVVNVETAVDLDEETLTKLEKLTAEKLNKNVHVNVKTNADLLGGLIIEMDGAIIDTTLRRKLKEMKWSLEAAARLL